MDLKEYLQRINYKGRLKPDLQTLQDLQKANLLNIPFENLDIHYGNPVILDTGRIFAKIRSGNRGGFCYELNSLFYELLTMSGFSAKRISARVYSKNNEYGPEYDHLAVLATIDGNDYLADVGFGEFAFGPLRLSTDKAQKDERGDYVIEGWEQGYLRVSKIENGKSTPQYIFKTIHRELAEFEVMCQYHQTSPLSHFTQKKLISRPTEKGRITLTTDNLKISDGTNTAEIPIAGEKEFAEALSSHFNINEWGLIRNC